MFGRIQVALSGIVTVIAKCINGEIGRNLKAGVSERGVKIVRIAA